MKHLKRWNESIEITHVNAFTEEEISELKEVVSYWADEFDFEIVQHVEGVYDTVGVFYYYYRPQTQFGLVQDEIDIDIAFVENYKGQYLKIIQRTLMSLLIL